MSDIVERLDEMRSRPHTSRRLLKQTDVETVSEAASTIEEQRAELHDLRVDVQRLTKSRDHYMHVAEDERQDGEDEIERLRVENDKLMRLCERHAIIAGRNLDLVGMLRAIYVEAVDCDLKNIAAMCR